MVFTLHTDNKEVAQDEVDDCYSVEGYHSSDSEEMIMIMNLMKLIQLRY